MELRPGYKQTEVGVIPKEWDAGCLGDKTTKVGSGITPTGGEKVYKQEGRPFLRSQNVGWGTLLMEDIAFIDDATHETFKATEIEVDDVFLNITGASIGRSAVADARVERGNVNQHVCIIRTNQNQLHPCFLNYFLLSEAGQRQIDSFQAGGNRQGLNFGQIRSFRLPVPPLPEQCAIAGALSDVDALIGALDSALAKKRAIKQAVMQQLPTGKTRLPGFSGEWELKKLLDLVGHRKDLFDDGDWVESEYITDTGIRLIQTGNIGEGRFLDKDTKRYISEDSYKKLGCKEVRIGDLLVCRLAEPAGRACIMQDIGENKMITAVDVTICRPLANQADPKYLVQLFSTHWWFERVELLCGGSTRSRIARGQLGRIEIVLPPVQEQTAIAAVLSDMDAEIAALEARLDKTKQIWQGMMQQLLTGRVRLVPSETKGGENA
jgi:type I restriction enzyme S subunit